MLSHDSGDIKNVENKLITKKIQEFEIRRNLYTFDSFYSIKNIPSIDTIFSSNDIESRFSHRSRPVWSKVKQYDI